MSRTFVITGAGTGIGKALAVALAGKGFSVVGVGRHESTLNETKAHHPSKISIIKSDLSDLGQRESLVKQLLALKQDLNLVHNAGTALPLCALADVRLEAFRQAMTLNVEAPLFLTQGLLPRLKNGRVLHISSGLAHHSRAGMATYCVSKAAFHMLYKCSAREFKALGVSVGSVMPGVVDTPMQDLICQTPEQQVPGVGDFISIRDSGRYVSPEVVAEFLVWLLCKTNADDFSRAEWDISDESHHKEWLTHENATLNWTFR